MEKDPFVSIILPAYNERENLKLLIPDISNILNHYNHEIIVIDDKSSDGTRYAICDFNIVYQYNYQRQGLANSIRLGIEIAKGNVIVVMDSDGDHNTIHLPLMIDNLKFYDVVLTSRFKTGSKVNGTIRSHLSKVFNFFIRAMTGGKLSDYLYGHWAANKHILQKTSFEKVFWGYGDYCIRLLFYFEKLDMKIHQLPCISGKREFGVGNFNPIRIFTQYTIAVLKLTLKERVLRVQKNKKLPDLSRPRP